MLSTWLNTLPDCQCFLELNMSLSLEARECQMSKLKKTCTYFILFSLEHIEFSGLLSHF